MNGNSVPLAHPARVLPICDVPAVDTVAVARKLCDDFVQNIDESARRLTIGFRRALDAGDFHASDGFYDDLKQKAVLKHRVSAISAALPTRTADDTLIVVWPASQVFDVRAACRRVEPETIHLAAATLYDNTAHVTRIVPLKLTVSQLAYAKSDPEDTRRVLRNFEARGEILALYVHMHPWNGPEAYGPSGTDLRMQEKYERAGYRTIGAIFSRDGFLRCFSKNLPFKVLITGNGVEHVAEDQFWLAES